MDILFVLSLESLNDIFCMIEKYVCDQTRQNCKPHSVTQGEGHWQEKGAIRFVLVLIKDSFAVQDTTRIVNTSCVVICIRAREGEIRRVPRVGIVKDRGRHGVYQKPTRKDIGLRPVRDGQGRCVIRNLAPIKCRGHISQTRGHTEEIVDDLIV